jgi:hypothetical protein
MDIHNRAATEIIKAQKLVIGPIAVEQAREINGLKLSSLKDIKITGNPNKVLTDLVNKYANFFGKASIEVCKDAIREMTPPISKDELPDVLK